MSPDEILLFWFEEIPPRWWFQPDASFDRLVTDRFGEIHRAASRCELWSWRATPDGRLAEILVLDQFSRNAFRGSAQAFAQDALALSLAQEAVRSGADQALKPVERGFLYMPYMHSESALIHLEALTLFAQPGLEEHYKFEIMHREIIDRFGRYPHRNALLNRVSTPEELEYLTNTPAPFG